MDGGVWLPWLRLLFFVELWLLGFLQEEAVAGEDVEANMDDLGRTMWQF